MQTTWPQPRQSLAKSFVGSWLERVTREREDVNEALPDSLHAVAIENYFIADSRHTFRLSLGNEHAIKGIFVGPWEQTRAKSMLKRNRQRQKHIAREVVLKVLNEVDRRLQLA